MVVTLAPRMWASVDSSGSTLKLAVIPAGQTFYQMGFASLELPFSAGRHSAGLLPAYWLFMYSLSAWIQQHYETGFCLLSIGMLLADSSCRHTVPTGQQFGPAQLF